MITLYGGTLDDLELTELADEVKKIVEQIPGNDKVIMAVERSIGSSFFLAYEYTAKESDQEEL